VATIRAAVTNYYRQVHGEVVRIANTIGNKPSAELIHDLRVQLKRIRFLRNLLKRYTDRDAVRKFRPYLEVFEQAGRIRGYQMNQYRLSGAPQAPDAREKKLTQEFCARLPKAVQRIDRAKKTIEQQLAVTEFPSVNAFVQQLHRRVAKRITPFLFTHQLHRSRKLLKEIAYSAELSPTLHAHIHTRYRMPAVAELEDKIGDWHDLALAERTRNLGAHTREKIAAQKRAKLEIVYQLLRGGLVRSK
jgi:CHAD domain-containing protein